MKITNYGCSTRSARKLAVPMPATPGPSQRCCVSVVGSVMAAVLPSEATSRQATGGLDLEVDLKV
jgi:hypothetical protein